MDELVNVAIECEDCNEVLLDFDQVVIIILRVSIMRFTVLRVGKRLIGNRRKKMNVGDLMDLLGHIDEDLSVVNESEQGIAEASMLSIFKNTNGEIVVQVE
jgi:hypothetical protein